MGAAGAATGLSRGGLYRHFESTGEFRCQDPRGAFDLMVFAYQGARLYSRLMPLPGGTPEGMMGQVRRLLLGPGMIRLERPALRHKELALEFREEFFSNNEPIIFGSELLDKTERYEDWLEAVTRNADPGTVSQEWVLTDTYFAVEGSGGVYERSFSHEGEDADIYAIRL